MTNTENKALAISMLEKMLEIRYMEETVERFFMQDLIGGTVHLYIGQEAVAVGACAAITQRDCIVRNHRGHGHFLAKGGDIAFGAGSHESITGTGPKTVPPTAGTSITGKEQPRKTEMKASLNARWRMRSIRRGVCRGK